MVKHIKVRSGRLKGTDSGINRYSGTDGRPAHVEVADTKVRPFTKSRACLDFEL